MNVRQWFGLAIKQKRCAKRLRQIDLADATGYSLKYIGEIERGIKNPTIKTYEVIFRVLHISMAYLREFK